MKKILLALILAMIFVLSFTLCVSAADGNSEADPQTKSPCEMILGDVDGDGEVTNADVLMIYRYIYNPELYPLPTICIHEFGDDSYYETTVVSATCSSEGYTLYTCKYCGFAYCDEFTEKTAHTFGDWEEMLSFCTARIMMRSCTECDYSMFNIENGDWHKYTSTVVEPTCTNEGYTLHKCETCNLEYRDTFTEKTPHAFGDWEEMTSSCTTKFSMCSCTECGYSTFRTENGDWHKYTSTVVKPTCSARGYTLYSCQNCNSNYTENYVDATGEHTWRELYVITSTCAEKKIVAICTDCNTTQIIECTPTEEHDYVVTVVPPTIEEQGYTEHTCKICGDSFKDSFVPVIGSVGLEFTSNGDGTCYVSGIGTCIDTDIVIPSVSPDGDSVTGIGKFAFYNCKSLTSVTIPDSVTSIGDRAFRGCTSLESITIPFVGATKNGTSDTHFGYIFGASSYSYNSTYVPASLKTVVVTGGESIGSGAFYQCASLKSVEIPDSVTSIGNDAFFYCTSLTSITIPDRVTSIGEWAFCGCKSLTSVTIGNSVMSIGTWAFGGCTSLASIEIPDRVTIIGYSAFNGCTSLTSIDIPDRVTSIGTYAFYNCTSLTSVTIGNSVTSIGDYAFCNCTSLTSVTIPDRVTIIGDYAFDDCTSLTSVTIGNSVTIIGDYAFYNCTSLTSIDIPDRVTSIGKHAFSDCTSLTSVTIGNSVTSIGTYAFYNCTSLKDVYIIDIEAWLNISFEGYFSHPNDYGNIHILDKEGNEITEVIIPDSISKIDDYAFRNCTSLESISIPDSVTSIGYSAFSDCKSLKDIYYTGTQEQWQKIWIGSNNSNLTSATIHYNHVAS